MSGRRGAAAAPRVFSPVLFALAAACSASPPPASRPSPAPAEAPSTALAPARWTLFDHLGTRFDEAGRGAPEPRPEPVIADGVRMIVDAGRVLASAPHAEHLSGFRSLPERLGGGFVLWSEDRVYLAKEFLGELSPVADVGATGGARPWLATVLLRTPSGLLELDPRAPAGLHRAALPGVADALALDARRAVRLDAFGRAAVTLDGGASWTEVRSGRVRAISEGADGGIVLAVEGSRELVLDAAGPLHPLPEPPAIPSLAEARPVEPLLPRASSSRALPDEILAQGVAYGALLPGARIAVARERGVRVLASATALAVADTELLGVDERFSRCQAVPLGAPPAGLACIADTGAALLDLDGPLSRPLLEATFPPGDGFFGGPRGRLAFDGGCGAEPPASTDLGPGTVKAPEPSEESPTAPVPAPAPEPPGATEIAPDDDARVCVRAARSRWVEHRLRGDDARRLYRWVPGEGGAVTAIVLTGGAPEDGGPDAGTSLSPGVTTTADGLRVVRVDPNDGALGGGAFPAVPPPQHDGPRRMVDTSFWQDDDGSIRGWVHLPAGGEEKVEAPPSPQGSAHRPLPVVETLGGRMAGVRIDEAGHVTVLPLPKGVVAVATGGPFGLAMADVVPDADGGPAARPAGRAWFETLDGGASWAPVEAPPVGEIETTVDTRSSFGCSPIGCALTGGVVRIGWGSKPPEPAAALTLTAAASPRLRSPDPLPLTCRLDGDALSTPEPRRAPRPPPPPPRAKPAAPPKLPPKGKPSHPRTTLRPPAAKGSAGAQPQAHAAPPLALRLPVTTFGALHDHTWTGDVLLPFQPASAPRRISATDPALTPGSGAVVPILAAAPGAPVDLLLLYGKRRLRAGAGPAAFVPLDVSFHPDVAADGPDGSLVLLDAARGNVWLTRGAATAAALHVLRVPDVSRTRLTLARSLAGGALALAGYSASTGELFAGTLDLARAEVGPLSLLGRLDALAEAGACPHATYRVLVELPVRLRVLGRSGEVLVDEEVTASVLLLAGGGSQACVEAVEAVPSRQRALLRATLGKGGAASAWSEGGTLRGLCSMPGRR